MIKLKTSRSYRGFSTVDGGNKGFAKYDFDIIKQDLINHFHIRQGEKLSDPKFGTIIWDLLYEPFTIDLQEAIVQNVTEIVNFDSRISVEEIVVEDTAFDFSDIWVDSLRQVAFHDSFFLS